MEYYNEDMDIIKRAGGLKFTMRQILYLLPKLDPLEFQKDFNNENHPVHIEYNKARCQAEMDIDEALQKNAKTGDTFSADLLDKKMYYNRINEAKREYFGT